MNPLGVACFHGLLPIVRILWPLSLPLPRISEALPWTPLGLAAQEGHDDVVRFLLREDPSLLNLAVRSLFVISR